MTVEKPKPKQLLRAITTGANSAMIQTQSQEITSNSLETREKSRVHGAIGFCFASHWLKNWRESFKPITNRNHVITFDSHLKTALITKRLTLRKCLFRIDVSVAAAVVASVKRPHNSVMADSDFVTSHSRFNASFFVLAMAYCNDFSIVSKFLCFFSLL